MGLDKEEIKTIKQLIFDIEKEITVKCYLRGGDVREQQKQDKRLVLLNKIKNL